MDPEFSNKNEKNDASSISSDLIRGHINTIILRTLYDGDKYGYEIINEIEEKSKGQYSLKQPTLYSALKRLESQDFVTSYWGGVSNGGRRKYFQITDKGRKVVEQNLAEWEYSRTVIDSLISEKDYDFSTPPPSGNVDFNLLKKSTTRVVIPGGEDENDAFDFTFGNGETDDASAAEEDTPIQGANETQEEQFGVQSAAQDLDANDEAPQPSAVQSEPAPAPAPDLIQALGLRAGFWAQGYHEPFISWAKRR